MQHPKFTKDASNQHHPPKFNKDAGNIQHHPKKDASNQQYNPKGASYNQQDEHSPPRRKDDSRNNKFKALPWDQEAKYSQESLRHSQDSWSKTAWEGYREPEQNHYPRDRYNSREQEGAQQNHYGNRGGGEAHNWNLQVQQDGYNRREEPHDSAHNRGGGPSHYGNRGGGPAQDSAHNWMMQQEGYARGVGSSQEAHNWVQQDARGGPEAQNWVQQDARGGPEAHNWVQQDARGGPEAHNWTQQDARGGPEAHNWVQQDARGGPSHEARRRQHNVMNQEAVVDWNPFQSEDQIYPRKGDNYYNDRPQEDYHPHKSNEQHRYRDGILIILFTINFLFFILVLLFILVVIIYFLA